MFKNKINILVFIVGLLAAYTIGASASMNGDNLFPFSDVYKSDWYANSVENLYKKRIVNGYGDDNSTFRPNGPASRGEITVMMNNLLNYIDRPDVTAINEKIASSLNKGVSVQEIEKVDLELPEGIHVNQLVTYFKIEDLYFALVMQKSMWVSIDTPDHFNPSFVGILAANKDDTKWTKYLYIYDEQTYAKNNPYYLWTENDKLYLSVQDAFGAGSGDGNMKFYSLDGQGEWNLEKCYYGPFGYGVPKSEYNLSNEQDLTLAECNNAVLK